MRLRNFDDIYARCNFCVVKPENFEEAVKEESWRKAMEDEIEVIEKNKTWKLVERPQDKKNYRCEGDLQGKIQCRWFSSKKQSKASCKRIFTAAQS